MSNKEALHKLTEFLQSDKGKEFRAKTALKLKKEYDHRSRWVNKIIENIKTKNVDELRILYNAFTLHDIKQTDVKWRRGVDGNSNLSFFIFKAFEKIGVDYEVQDGMFTAAAFEYRGYIAELIVGQGSFISIYYKP